MAFQQTVRRIQLGRELRRIREERKLPPEDVAKALPTWSVHKISREVRMARQSVLTRPKPPEVWAVIHEAALKVKGGGADVMRAQMERLIQLTRLPNVNIQIMPSDCALNPGMNGALTILGFTYRPALDIALVAAQQTELWIEDRESVGEFHAAFQKITAEALPLDKSLAFITEQRDGIK
ncbi:DUF5753 domain-containing protein [Kitasatospora purpeofusca]|uniref:DUF5753 domain-containing protein n=1 Tax=Kitasatospora purpeofusca TaxID=67352 RepID=UPI003865E660|nr:DUF5753 domain-containing protein [Kitasatospora purpeofusca]